MPYTPPSNTSPASSKTSSPVASRSGSFHEDVPRSPMTSRPQPPRSMSSASYMQRHRRTPSLGKSDGGIDLSVSTTDFAGMNSIRQSPPPVNNLRMPTGAVISPPDSSENSDGDDSATRERGRELQANWDKLQEAVRGIPQQRDGSPEKTGLEIRQLKSEPVSQTTSPTALSVEARRISHSRSSTEGNILIKVPYPTQSGTNSDDSDEEDLLYKPALVRKKSGELVKPALRPSSRRRYSSMPGTPTYSKSVHFNDSDNQTRHFLQVDKPIAVSAGSSPVEPYDSDSEFPFDEEEAKKQSLDIKTINFPQDTFERKTKPVYVERIYLSSDKSNLIGSCVVQNISFHKQVVARFTLDYWKTTSEVVAEYHHDARHPTADGCDRFNFQIKLTDQANIHTRTLLLCVRYNVGGQEYWDNNDNTNYQIDFVKTDNRPSRPSKPLKASSLGQRTQNTIPRSRHSPTSSRTRFESADDDFAVQLDNESPYHFNSSDKLFGESPSSSIKLKPRPKRTPMFATGPPQAAKNLGSRYDFGTSLSAALSTAQEKLGQQSGLMRNQPNQTPSGGSYFGPLDRTEPTVDTVAEKPTDITSDRPAIGSEQYKDLVQKFCYVGSARSPAAAAKFTTGSGKSTASPVAVTPKEAVAVTEPAAEHIEDVSSAASESDSSGANSPVQLDGAQDQFHHQQQSQPARPFAPRTGSPVPIIAAAARSSSPSPLGFGYPFHTTMRNGYFDTPVSTAIQG